MALRSSPAGTDRPAGHGKADQSLDHLHAMQFRPPPPPQVRDGRLAQWPPWSDRGCPLDTARDRCLWHAGGTAGENDDASPWWRWLQLGQRGRPAPGDHRLAAMSPKGPRQVLIYVGLDAISNLAWPQGQRGFHAKLGKGSDSVGRGPC